MGNTCCINKFKAPHLSFADCKNLYEIRFLIVYNLFRVKEKIAELHKIIRRRSGFSAPSLKANLNNRDNHTGELNNNIDIGCISYYVKLEIILLKIKIFLENILYSKKNYSRGRTSDIKMETIYNITINNDPTAPTTPDKNLLMQNLINYLYEIFETEEDFDEYKLSVCENKLELVNKVN
jgi:hypothetical protein